MKKALLVLLLFFFPSIAYPLTVGDSAPALNAATIDGRQINYHKDIKGSKALYIVFWATW